MRRSPAIKSASAHSTPHPTEPPSNSPSHPPTDASAPARTLSPEGLQQALFHRWQAPTPAQQEALGHQLWADMLSAPLGELVPQPIFLEAYHKLMSRHLVRTIWQLIPRDLLLADIERLRASGQTLGDVLGPEVCSLLREGAEQPWKPNRELTEQLLDQPLLRQALKSMVQQILQQFLSSLSNFGQDKSGQAARGSVFGALSRSIANRASTAVQIGKTFVEGVGGSLFSQLEDQIQPFLSGYMSRSVKLLTDGLFNAENSSELARETRLRVLEILFQMELGTLLTEPTPEDLDRVLMGVEALTARVTGMEAWQKALESYLLVVYRQLEPQTLQTFLQRNRISIDAEPAVYQALGALGYQALVRPGFQAFLLAELAAVMGHEG